MATREQKARAAILLGHGWSRKAVCAEIGVDPSTVSRWRRDHDFERQVRRVREGTLDERPSVRAVLEAGLVATKRDGSPDYVARLKAAQLLMQMPPDDADPNAPQIVTERIYVDRLGNERAAA